MTQRLDYEAATPAGVKALGAVYGHVARSGLPKRLVNLVYLRVSQINGCAYCIDMHSKDARALGESEERIGALVAWLTYAGFLHSRFTRLPQVDDPLAIAQLRSEQRARMRSLVRRPTTPSRWRAQPAAATRTE